MSYGKLLGIIAVVLVGGLGCGYLIIDNTVRHAIDETYSPSWLSESIQDSKRRGLWLKTPKLEKNQIEEPGGTIKIEEAWIERQIQVEYDWIWRKSERTIGYRLVVRTDRMPYHIAGKYPLTCLSANDASIICSHTGRSGAEITFGRIEPPFPDTLLLEIAGK